MRHECERPLTAPPPNAKLPAPTRPLSLPSICLRPYPHMGSNGHLRSVPGILWRSPAPLCYGIDKEPICATPSLTEEHIMHPSRRASNPWCLPPRLGVKAMRWGEGRTPSGAGGWHKHLGAGQLGEQDSSRNNDKNLCTDRLDSTLVVHHHETPKYRHEMTSNTPNSFTSDHHVFISDHDAPIYHDDIVRASDTPLRKHTQMSSFFTAQPTATPICRPAAHEKLTCGIMPPI